MFCMHYRFLVLTAFGLFICDERLFAQAGDAWTAQQHYEHGRELQAAGRPQDAISAFESAILSDPNFANAHHQLGLLYMNPETLEGKAKAKEALQTALRIDSDNPSYHLAMAHLFLKQGMARNARTRFEQVVRLDSLNVESFYNLGLLKEQDMLEYGSSIGVEENAAVGFNKFARQDLQEAKAYFQRAIALVPNHGLAYYHLALIQHELGDYKSMAEYLERAVEIEPNGKDFHLFLGLAHHRLRNERKAEQHFTFAKDLMGADERALFESPAPLQQAEMNEKPSSMSAGESTERDQRFWKQRDPVFMSDFNERLLEHYARFAYANLRFRRPGVEGWKTDQGNTHIRFGAPTNKKKVRPSLQAGSGTSARSMKLAGATETWRYDGFTLVFEDEFMSGNFALLRGMSAATDYKYILARTIEKTPERYELDLGDGSEFKIHPSFTQYKGAGGKTRIEIFYRFRTRPITIHLEDGGYKVDLKRGFFVFDESWNELQRSVERRHLVLISVQDASGRHHKLDRYQTELLPGTYHVALELLDEPSGNLGKFRHKTEARTFHGTQLQISDLLLADDVSPNDVANPYQIGELRILPNLFGAFEADQPIFVYYELYNLALDEEGASRYRVELSVRSLAEQKNVFSTLLSRVGELAGRSASKETAVSSSFDYSGNATEEPTYAAIQLSDPKPGNYVLTIKVTDLNTGKVVTQESSFEISSSEVPSL